MITQTEKVRTGNVFPCYEIFMFSLKYLRDKLRRGVVGVRVEDRIVRKSKT